MPLGVAACRAAERADELPREAIPERGTVRIERSTRIEPGEVLRAPLAVADPPIVIEDARDVLLDLTGVVLRGGPADADLDQHAGRGVVVRRSSGVTIRGGELGGFRVCLWIEDSTDVTVEGVRFEGWYGQRLASTAEAEDPSDWLWPHENDAGEWLARYGAAIGATGCRNLTVRDCRGRRGQNGILLTRTTDSAIYDDDFSFLSGWGLGMYRAERNTVSRNRFDYCVRGYSHDVYWRGQDSAGILMFERCCDNVVAFNSATHGGDGLFLYGGQDLVEGRAAERGEADAGGSDRNLFLGNDFSFAVANAFEGTFSADNALLDNRLNGSRQHGVWGGYSSRMVVAGNEIADNRGGGVSIEHGQECLTYKNSIRRNEIGVELWWDPDPELVGGPFGAARDTDSRDHWILSNDFEDDDQDLVLRSTRGLRFGDNRFAHPSRGGEMDLSADALHGDEEDASFEELWSWLCDGAGQPGGLVRDIGLVRWPGGEPPGLLEAARLRVPARVPGRTQPFDPGRPTPGGLATIVMGEWGPWDFESGAPRPAVREPGGLLADVVWSVTWIDSRQGPYPGIVPESWREQSVPTPLATGEHRGAWTTPFPTRSETDQGPGEGAPGGAARPFPTEQFGLVATGTVTLERAGRYRLSTVSDDGVRVRVDGRVALEDWTTHAPRRDTAALELAAGEHALELEYFQDHGASALSVRLDLVDDADPPGAAP